MEQNAQLITGLIKMSKESSQKLITDNKNSVTSSFIILCLSIIYIFCESLIIILSIFKKGIFKKEILTKETNLGFDLIIKRK